MDSVFNPAGYFGFDGDASAIAIINACIWIISFCLISSLTILFLLIVLKLRHRIRESETSKLEEKYTLLLTGILFPDDDKPLAESKEKLIKHFRKRYLKSYFNRHVLRKQLLLLHRNLSGQSADILKDLYYELNLFRDPMRAMRDTDWSLRAESVRELMQMRYPGLKPLLPRLTRNENPVLRLEAQTAMMVMSAHNPFAFLDKTRARLTEWHQLNLEEMAKKLKPESIPLFSNWFGSDNPSVVAFCIRMACTFNQFEAEEHLAVLVGHRDEKISREAIKASGKMVTEQAVLALVNAYEGSSSLKQDEILQALGLIGGYEATEFLTKIMQSGPASRALQAAMALKQTGTEGINRLYELSEKTSSLAALTKHVLDERI